SRACCGRRRRRGTDNLSLVIASEACSPDERSEIRGPLSHHPGYRFAHPGYELRRWSIQYALPYPRHCERSEAIHLSVREVTMDCFALLAMTVDMVSRSRGASRPRLASSFALLE